MIIAIAIVFSLYLALLLWLLLELMVKNKNNGDISHSDKDFFSVIIPVKDEIGLHHLLEDLFSQDFRSSYEIIVVDDHSTKKVQPLRGEKIIRLGKDENGKKAALTKGINAAEGNVIITIDGDCRVGKYFLHEVSASFANDDIVLSPGLIRYAPLNNLFEKMQAVETAAIMGTGLALHKAGYSSLSNGANLAFRKHAWLQIGGYEQHKHIPTGDDEFFVQEVGRRFKAGITFRESVNSVVTTRPNRTFKELFFQRLRWASKWRYYSSVQIKAVALFTFLIHLAICGAIILLFTENSLLIFILFLAKVLLEGWLIIFMSQRIGQRFYLFGFIILQFVYSPYVAFFGILSNFLPYKWKGRKFSH